MTLSYRGFSTTHSQLSQASLVRHIHQDLGNRTRTVEFPYLRWLEHNHIRNPAELTDEPATHCIGCNDSAVPAVEPETPILTLLTSFRVTHYKFFYGFVPSHGVVEGQAQKTPQPLTRSLKPF